MPRVDIHNPSLWEMNYLTPLPHDMEVCLHYSRAGRFDNFRILACSYIEALNLTSTSKILIIGAGYGFTQEWLEKLVPGITVVSTDISDYIQKTKQESETISLKEAMSKIGIEEGSLRWNNILKGVPDHSGPKARVSIYPFNISEITDHKKIKEKAGLTNQKFTWGITEQVFPWLTDKEAIQMNEASLKICSKTCHFLTEFIFTQGKEPEPIWNWKWARDTDEPTRSDLQNSDWYVSTSWKKLFPGSMIITQGNYKVY